MPVVAPTSSPRRRPPRLRAAVAGAVACAALLALGSWASVAGASARADAGTGLPGTGLTGTASPGSPAAGPAVPVSQSYSLLTTTGRLVGYGGALSARVPAPSATVVGVAPTPDGRGAWVAEADGSVVAVGDAASHGQAAGTALPSPVVGIAADPVTGGYWLATAAGGVDAFGAPSFGSVGSVHLNQPVVGMAATPDGGGYWLVAADGGIFAFGNATFFGSTGSMHLNQPVVGMAATPDGGGYWLVAADGGIFAFGDATFFGSTGSMHLVAPVVGMATPAGGGGYWLVAADGGVFAFGRAPFYGSGAGTGDRVVAMAVGDGGYQNPLRAVAGLRAGRIDQGVDYAGAGPVYAVGDGVVTSTTNSGWPGGAFIAYRLTDGPAAGRYVYVAENVVPEVAVGQQVTPSTVLGILVDASPDMETGWAAPPGLGNAAAGAAGQWTAATDRQSIPTAYGENFSQLMAALGAPPGIGGAAPTGSLPAGWPTW